MCSRHQLSDVARSRAGVSPKLHGQAWAASHTQHASACSVPSCIWEHVFQDDQLQSLPLPAALPVHRADKVGVLVALQAVPGSTCSRLGAQRGLPALSHHEIHVGCTHQSADNADRCPLKIACSTVRNTEFLFPLRFDCISMPADDACPQC